MKTLHRFLCWLGIHSLPEGVDPQWSVRWACAECGSIQDGELAKGKRR